MANFALANSSIPGSSTVSSNSLTSRSVSNSVISGYLAGAFGVVVGQPLDCLKVYAQTQSTFIGPTTATRLPARIARIKALYAGIQGPLVLVGMVQSLNFVTYDSLRRILYPQADYRTKDPLQNVVFASSATGGLIATLTSPFLVIKTRQQLYHQGFREAMSNLSAEGGWRSFYVGFGPHLVTETVGRAFYLGTYEFLKRTQQQKHEDESPLTLPERMVCAGLAGTAGSTVVYPFDTLKSIAYAAQNGSQTRSVATSSLRALYRGFGVTVLRSGPVKAAVLPLYDLTLDYLQSL